MLYSHSNIYVGERMISYEPGHMTALLRTDDEYEVIQRYNAGRLCTGGEGRGSASPADCADTVYAGKSRLQRMKITVACEKYMGYDYLNAI